MKPATLLFALLSFSAAAVVAQDINATLRGVVADATGAVIPNATVQITNVEKGISRSVLTNKQGEYEASQLAPQAYAVTVSASGFKTQVRNQYTLQTAQEARLNFRLSIGESSEQIVVTADASLLQSEDTGSSEVIDEKKVQELPQNGRNAFSLALLAPNVYGTLGSTTYSVAGNPSVNNNYLLDGVQNNDRTTGSPTLKPAEDGVQEFRILTGQYAAEYGRQSGGQVIMTTKSGDNFFHGTVYDYVRDNVTDARNYFSTAALPPFTQNQFGASFGGPIRKSKTFFFGTYEGLRQTKDAVTVSTVPTDQERGGDFSQLATTSKPNPITLNGTPTTVVPANQLRPQVWHCYSTSRTQRRLGCRTTTRIMVSVRKTITNTRCASTTRYRTMTMSLGHTSFTTATPLRRGLFRSLDLQRRHAIRSFPWRKTTPSRRTLSTRRVSGTTGGWLRILPRRIRWAT